MLVLISLYDTKYCGFLNTIAASTLSTSRRPALMTRDLDLPNFISHGYFLTKCTGQIIDLLSSTVFPLDVMSVFHLSSFLCCSAVTKDSSSLSFALGRGFGVSILALPMGKTGYAFD